MSEMDGQQEPWSEWVYVGFDMPEFERSRPAKYGGTEYDYLSAAYLNTLESQLAEAEQRVWNIQQDAEVELKEAHAQLAEANREIARLQDAVARLGANSVDDNEEIARLKAEAASLARDLEILTVAHKARKAQAAKGALADELAGRVVVEQHEDPYGGWQELRIDGKEPDSESAEDLLFDFRARYDALTPDAGKEEQDG